MMIIETRKTYRGEKTLSMGWQSIGDYILRKSDDDEDEIDQDTRGNAQDKGKVNKGKRKSKTSYRSEHRQSIIEH